MTSGRNFNSLTVNNASVTIDALVRNEASRQFYPPPIRVFGNRPPLGNIYTVFNSNNIVTDNPVNRAAVPSQVLSTANIYNYNKFRTPSESYDSRPSALFVPGAYSQPALISSGYGSGTISVVASGINEYGTAIWTFDLTNLATTRGLVKGSVIRSQVGNGNFGVGTTVYVSDVINNSQVSCIAFRGAGPTQGIVNVIQTTGRIIVPQITRVRLITGSTDRWTFTITGIVGTQSFIPGDVITFTPNSDTTGSFGVGNTVYVTKVVNDQELTCDTIDGTGGPVQGQISSLIRTGQTVLFTPSEIQVGEAEYTTPGTYQWTAPPGVTSVSVVAVGGGGGGLVAGSQNSGGGGGGGLGWKNNIPVTPGQSYTVVVGSGVPGYTRSTPSSTSPLYPNPVIKGEDSFFINSSTVAGLGGFSAHSSSIAFNAVAPGGGFVGDGGGNGGEGGVVDSSQRWARGGGGAGGYIGNGGRGGIKVSDPVFPAGAGSGGAASGGNGSNIGFNSTPQRSAGGGGVGIYGIGSSGAAPTLELQPGNGGSGGEAGTSGISRAAGGAGGGFGGGGGGIREQGATLTSGAGGGGAVRIVWGLNRRFPDVNVQKTVVLTVAEESPFVNTIISTPSLSILTGTANDVKRQNSISTSQLVSINSTARGQVPAIISRTRMEILNNSLSTATGINSRIPNIQNNFVPTRIAVDRYANETWQNYPVRTASAFFDGSGDFLTIPSSNAFGFGTGDFTVEAWVNTTTFNSVVFDNRTVNEPGVFFIHQTTGRIGYFDPTVASISGSTTNCANGSWNHLAWCRSGSTFRMFVNGQQEYSGTLTSNFGTTRPARIGSSFENTALFNGRISNLRVVKGTALYTANFTLPTQALTAIPNTSLLTLRSDGNLFFDESGLNNAITRNGDVRREDSIIPFTQSSTPIGVSVTNVSIGGADTYGVARLPILSSIEGTFSNIATTVNVDRVISIGSGPVRILQVFDKLGPVNYAFSRSHTDNFYRTLDDYIADESTEPVMVYTQNMLITDANRPKAVIPNNSIYDYRAATVEVNGDTISVDYAAPATSNAFPITTANRPIINTNMLLNNQYSFRVNTITNYTDYIDRRSEPTETVIVTESIVAAQPRVTLLSSQGTNAGLSRSFTSAPFGTAGVILPGDGGLTILASTEFWV